MVGGEEKEEVAVRSSCLGLCSQVTRTKANVEKVESGVTKLSLALSLN